MNVLNQNTLNYFVTTLSSNTLTNFDIKFTNVQDNYSVTVNANDISLNKERFSQFDLYLQDYLSPNLTVDGTITLSADTYYVYDSITVPTGTTLDIATGTTVYCLSGLTSGGTIVNEQNILFTSPTAFSILKTKAGNHTFEVINNNIVYKKGIAYVKPLASTTKEYEQEIINKTYEYRG